jgi:ADP-heptose:LPS heptosyltransferase
MAERTRPDLVIDFEPHGLRTSILAWWVGLRAKAPTVGIAQVPLRRAFYTLAAPGMRRYAELRGLPFPIEYTERDFVALAALGIERNGMPIELRECEVARAFHARLLAQAGTERPLLGLNIGCGLAGSTHRRPDMELIARLTRELVQRHGFDLVMTGAPFESEINEEFLRRFPVPAKVTNLAGKTSIRELTGAIAACRMLISGDSGPYHMGVALRIPTLALFNFPNPVHYHHHPWIQCLVAPTVAAFPEAMAAAERLLALPTAVPG